MPVEVTIAVAIISAIAGLAVAAVSIVPEVGRLRRLERVVAILEKVKEPEPRQHLIEVRDYLIAKVPKADTGAVVRGLRVLAILSAYLFVSTVAGAWIAQATDPNAAPNPVMQGIATVSLLVLLALAGVLLTWQVWTFLGWLSARRKSR